MSESETIQLLKERLLSYGADEAELDEIINDVNTIVIQRVIKDYLSTIDDPEVKKLVEASASEELLTYFEQNISKFPNISTERFQQIAEQTWSEYFDFMDEGR